MTRDAEREAFEAEYQGRVNFERNHELPELYAWERARLLWEGWQAGAAWQRAQSAPAGAVQWWLAKLDRYGNPTLTDGMHPDQAGANRAFYLHGSFGFTDGERYAVAKVELFEPVADSAGVNHEAVAIVQASLAASTQPAARQEQGDDFTPPEILASRLIDAWCQAHGKPVPWAKAVQITGILTKQPQEEIDRLLAMDDSPQGDEVRRLREALEQYADDSNWCFDTCNISRDVARAALSAGAEGKA